MGLRYIVSLFDKGNVIVTGLRGTGKDMLFANVISRRRMPYVSNVDYMANKCPFIKLRLDDLKVGNNYHNFIDGDIIPYEYPYPERCDIYISDAGVYFPSQYQDKLCREYPDMPVFQALSRQLGDCNFHCNVQNLNRLWDKIREQSDTYIRSIWCRVIGNIVVMKVIIYDKYESCLNRVEPFKPLPIPLFAKSEARASIKVHNDELRNKYRNEYGSVHSHILIFTNKSKYDTRLFKSLLSGGKI